MYTYGYIVDSVLAKMDMSREIAQKNGFLNKISYYANEAMTQICSAVKPNRKFAEFVVVNIKFILEKLKSERPDDTFEFLSWPWERVKNDTDEWHQQCWKEYHSLTPLGSLAKMPDDFISFGDEVNKKTIINSYDEREMVTATSEDYMTRGSNCVMFMHSGIFFISYNATWFTFDSNTDYDDKIDAPADVIECLPSYIASQLFKIDDETKSQIYRNEYEQFLARIDDDHYIDNGTIEVTGDW